MAYLLLNRSGGSSAAPKAKDPGQQQKRPMKSPRIFVPTYTEADNAERLCHESSALELGANILFCDDALPDGTGEMVARLVHETEATSQIGLAA
jgi:hypothetical protein